MRYSKAELVRMLLQSTKRKTSRSDYLMDLISKQLKMYQFAEVEYFLEITIGGDGLPIKIHEISKGTMNHAIVSPRDVFRIALLDNAASIIVLHNHPSGNISPSEDDRKVTKRLVQAGIVIGIDLLDHILIGPNVQYFSYNESEAEFKRYGKVLTI